MKAHKHVVAFRSAFGVTLAVVAAAALMTAGTARAQGAITGSTRTSISGVQSVTTHIRDSLQHRRRAKDPERRRAIGPACHAAKRNAHSSSR
jgi:hypothetical protein